MFGLMKGEMMEDGGDVWIGKNWGIGFVSQERGELEMSGLA